MNNINKIIFIIFFLWLLFCFPIASSIMPQEQFDDFAELNIEDLLNQEVTIATKTKQRISEAPGILTVITAEEIKNMGARDLRDVLKNISGFDVSTSIIGWELISVRGAKDYRTNTKLLLLIDGFVYNNLLYGHFNPHSELPIENIKKIEIIRGPGSALYGRNAFVGVINIITKTQKDNPGFKIKTNFDNYKMKQITASYGNKYKDCNFYIFGRLYKNPNQKLDFKDDSINRR